MSSQPPEIQDTDAADEQDHSLRQRLEAYLEVAPLSGNLIGDLLSGQRQPGDAVKLPKRLHAFLRETVSTVIRIERTQESIQDTVEANAREQQELKEEIAALQDEIKELRSETATVEDIEMLLDQKEFVTDADDDNGE